MNEQDWAKRQRAQRAYRMARQQKIAQESDAFFDDVESLAVAAQHALDKTQIRKFERTAYSADKLADIYDFIKNQVGKDGKEKKGWNKDGLGTKLFKNLRDLGDRATRIRDDLKEVYEHTLPDKDWQEARRLIWLDLSREWVKHFAAAYLYRLREEAT